MANNPLDRSIQDRLVKEAQSYYGEQRAETYRASDSEYLSDNTKHFDMFQALGEVTEQLGRPVRALDLGCGTGRYFHALSNTTHIVGIDASPKMIEAAHHPIEAEKISAEVTLHVSSLFDADFQHGIFDFVYCNGLLGQWALLTPALLNRIWHWLESGYFLCTIISTLPPEATKTTWKYSVTERIKPYLPKFLQSYLIVRRKQFAMTEEQIRQVVSNSHFKTLRLCRRLSQTGRIDLICIMGKDHPLPTKLAGHSID